VSYAETVLKYLSPAKSPFYAVMVVANVCVGWSHSLLLGNDGGISVPQFYSFVIPITGVIALGLYASFRNVYELPPAEHDEQIRFTRSFCISVALICLIWNGHVVRTQVEGYISYWSCIAQLVLFITYTFIRSRKEQAPQHSNLIQLGLITAAFMVGFSYILHIKAPDELDPSIEKVKSAAYLFGMPAAFWVLYAAWFICTLKWVLHFATIVEFKIKELPSPSPEQGSPGS
jgi:hypothetical protein